MPFNGSGAFAAPGASFPAVASTLIESAKFNAVINDIATGLTTCITKDGQTTVTANIPFGGYKLTGVGAATARTDAATLATIQDGTGVYVGTVGGTADAITLTPSPPITAYAAGQRFYFIASGTNTGATTVAISSLAAKNVTKIGATALVAGDITSAEIVVITYDGTQFQLGSPGKVLTGDISDDQVTYAKIQNVSATDKVLGRSTAGAGDVEEIACTAAGRALIDDANAGAQRTTLGLGGLAVLNGVGQGEIDASAVGQGELKTTTASGSLGVAASGSGSYTLTGGTYSWWTAGADSVAGTDNFLVFGAGDVAAGLIGLVNRDGTNTRTIYVDERYVQASPPYRKRFFSYLAVDRSKNIVHSSFAPDPPYAYHGPVDITPQYRRAGKLYRRVNKINGTVLHDIFKDPALLKLVLEGDVEITQEEVEIDIDYKESNMPFVPHPFVKATTTGLTIVHLEIPDAMADFFEQACNSGYANEIRKLVLQNKLDFDNERLDISHTPPGVMPVRARWR